MDKELIDFIINLSEFEDIDDRKYAWCRKYIKPEMIVVDAGACVGRFTKLFAELANEGKIIAFEPESRNFDRLSKLAEEYKNIITVRAALSDYNGESKLYVDKHRRIGWHSLKEIEHCDIEIVPVFKLNTYLKSCNIYRIDVLKMDVEGHDLQVLQGLDRIIDNSDNMTIIAELHHKKFGVNMELIFDFLSSKRFEIYNIVDSISLVTDYKKLDEEIIAIRS